MQPDYEKQLEEAVSRELGALGELRAPDAIASRVMSRIEQRAAVPWYRTAWQNWPRAMQAASFVALLALAVGIYYGLGGLTQHATTAIESQKSSGWFAQLEFVWSFVSALGQAGLFALSKLGSGVVLGIILLGIAIGSACVGLSSAYVRFGLATARR